MNLSKYKSTKLSVFILVLFLLAAIGLAFMKRESVLPLFSHNLTAQRIKLPAPVYRSNTSIEEALKQRRSLRHYKDVALTLPQVSQLLWAAQGITAASGFRTAPSAGGLYPLEIYLVSGNVQDLPAGIYRYVPAEQSLEVLAKGDKRKELAALTQGQNDLKDAALALIIAATYKKTNEKYGNHGERFVNIEVGHAAQNIYLQSVSLGLGTVGIGVFDETALKQLLTIPHDEEPIYILPVGKP